MHKYVNMYGEKKIVTAMLKPIVKFDTKFKGSRKEKTSIIDSIATFVYLINIKTLKFLLPSSDAGEHLQA